MKEKRFITIMLWKLLRSLEVKLLKKIKKIRFKHCYKTIYSHDGFGEIRVIILVICTCLYCYGVC